MSESKDILIAALEESIEFLQEENSRYRRTNSLLRRIVSGLRETQRIQHENDEAFKASCTIEIGTDAR